jgi:heterodisulfide reductase subunit A
MPGDIRPEYGFGRYPNVITSLQFERMLSASGPFGGSVRRPSDQAHPHRIAWIQCVGSRDCTTGRGDYCSAVCCLYATKEAIIAKEHDPAIQPTLFYIDLRSFGKGFEAYIERARSEHGLHYIRCMVSAVREDPQSRNLRLQYAVYEGDGDRQPVLREEEFDLVVLSVGLRPSAAAQALAARLGVELNPFGFATTHPDSPTQTSQPGLFVAGAFAEPKDIPESVIEASCAAARISASLSEARGSLTRVAEYPPERDVADEPVRTGVFICHCGINIGSVVNVPEVVAYARSLPGVAYAEQNQYTCSQDTQERLCQNILAYGLNRVVVASCTPRTHEPLFQDTLRQAGLNPHLFEMANIREQDAWVHRSDPAAATKKAQQLVRMAVEKARSRRAIWPHRAAVNPHALVIGGGLAGMTAALSIAHQGFTVSLVEREPNLGGNLRRSFTPSPDGLDPQALLGKIVTAVHQEPRIQVFLESEVVEFNGYKGQYRSAIRQVDGSTLELEHGVVLVATGGQEITPVEYLYGRHPHVISQHQLEERLRDPRFLEQLSGQQVVMIQCVGSRQEGRPYCSRVCCAQALKNALWIKRHAAGCQVCVLYRDMRSYGFREAWYREARQAGVVFLEYAETAKPNVSAGENGQLQVRVALQPENKGILLQPNWLILSAGIEPEPGNAGLARLLKVPLDENGFFLEAHVKLRPVDFAAEGIFLCGLAHSPRSLQESMAQAEAAAVRCVGLLSKPSLEANPLVAEVNPRLCAACGLCVEVCPYGARRLEPGMAYAEVIEVLCQGCGACVAACPNKASQQKGFELQPVLEMITAAG